MESNDMKRQVDPDSKEQDDGMQLRHLGQWLSALYPITICVVLAQADRAQGTFERFRAVLHDLGFHYNVSVLATYSGRPISRDLLISALRVAVLQHPALSVTISGEESTKPHFVSLKEIDLNKLVTFVDRPLDILQRAERVDEILSEQHSLGFRAEGLPLWRIVVFDSPQARHDPTTDIAFVWHHVIGDGASGLAVHSTILRALSSPEVMAFDFDKELVQTGSSIIIPAPRKSLYASMEEIFSLPRTLSLRISNLLHNWFPWGQNRKNVKKWSGAPYHCESPIRTRIKHISIPASSLQTLIDCCRREKTTMTPLLQTIVGKTLCESFETAGRLRCAVAISLRRFIPLRYQIHDDAMGLWVSAFHVEYSRTQLLGKKQGEGGQNLWKEARKNSRRVRQEVRKKDRNLSTGMLRYVPDFRSTLVNKMGKKRDDSFAITNLGSFDSELLNVSKDLESDSAQLCISDLLFSQSCHVQGSALQFCIVSVKGGDLKIAISWQVGTVEDAEVEQVAAALKKSLLQLCN